MDPHFSEYLAAIAGMREIYGDHLEDHPTEFHDEHSVVTLEEQTVAAA